MSIDRLRWYLETIGTTQPEEVDCDTVFELMEAVVEQAAVGADVAALFPEIALHLDHCPTCRDLFDTLVELTRNRTS